MFSATEPRGVRSSRQAAERARASKVRRSRRLLFEGLEARHLLTLDGTLWIPQGPSPVVESQSLEGLSNPVNPVAGAIRAVLADPGDAGTLYIGTAGGGVWKTTSADESTVTWTPVTDSLRIMDGDVRIADDGLSISTMVFDTADASRQTIVAATGGGVRNLSASGELLGSTALHQGLLATSDGGTTWTQIVGTDGGLRGRDIRALAVHGSSMLVSWVDQSVDPSNGQITGQWQLLSSRDGGGSFDVQLHPSGGTFGPIVSIVADPTNPDRVYIAEMPWGGAAGGVYRGDRDAGLNWTWHESPLSAALREAISATETVDIELSVSGDGDALYIAILTRDGFTQFARTSFLASDPGTATWIQLASPAWHTSEISETRDPRLYDARANLAILAGPEGIAGTEQLTLFASGPAYNPEVESEQSGSSGARQSSGRVTRIDRVELYEDEQFSQLEVVQSSLTHFAAPLTRTDRPVESIATSAGARVITSAGHGLAAGDMVHVRFEGQPGLHISRWVWPARPLDANRFVLEGTENIPGETYSGQGTWYRYNGGQAPPAGSRQMVLDADGRLITVTNGGIYRRTNPFERFGEWSSLNGNLSISQLVGVEWDRNFDRMLGVALDVGYVQQSSSDPTTWRQIGPGVGGPLLVDDSEPGRTRVYTSDLFLENLTRSTTTGDASAAPLAAPVALRIEAQDPAGEPVGSLHQFESPDEIGARPLMALSQGSGQRMVMATRRFLYESLDRGESWRILNGLRYEGNAEHPIRDLGEISALAYGTPSDPDVIYLATKDGRIYVRPPQTPTGSLDWLATPIATRSSFSVSDGHARRLIVDPRDWRHLLGLWQVGTELSVLVETSDAGASWNRIGAPPLNDIAFVPGQYYDVLVAAYRDRAGVVAINNLGQSDQPIVEIGRTRTYTLTSGMPVAPVQSLLYDPGFPGQGDEVLAVGSLGRGASKLLNPDDMFTKTLRTGEISDADFSALLRQEVPTSATLHPSNTPLLVESQGEGRYVVAYLDPTSGEVSDLLTLTQTEPTKFSIEASKANGIPVDAHLSDFGFQGQVILTFTDPAGATETPNPQTFLIDVQPNRDLQAAAALFVASGPAPLVGGQVAGMESQGNPVTGAVQVILPHPTNPDILYAGTAGGGVWRTDNATSTSPRWRPLTDSLVDAPSGRVFAGLSVSSMVFDTSDPSGNTILVGIGNRSAAHAREAYEHLRSARPMSGLLRTRDGGESWEVVRGSGDNSLEGHEISGVAAQGRHLVAAWHDFIDEQWRLLTSHDGGETFQPAQHPTSAAFGAITSIVADPRDPSRVFVAEVPSSAGSGAIYQGTRDANDVWHWQRLSFADEYLSTTPRDIRLAVSPDGQFLYLAAFAVDSSTRVARWDLSAGSQIVGDPITTVQPRPEGPIVYDLHPDAGLREFTNTLEGRVNLSLVGTARDPWIEEICVGSQCFDSDSFYFVGGQRQPGPLSRAPFDQFQGNANSLGATGPEGRLFRGEFSRIRVGDEWIERAVDSQTSLTHNAADGTAPHAGSRSLAFDAQGNLLESDDGGIYRRADPYSESGRWSSVNGDLQVAEMTRIDWDRNFEVLVGAILDLGTARQRSSESTTWTSLDNGRPGVFAVDDSQSGETWIYSSRERLAQFVRRRVTDSARPESDYVEDIRLLVDRRDSGLPEDIALFGFDSLEDARQVVMTLSGGDSQRMVLGTNGLLYESLDRGDHLRVLNGLQWTSELWRPRVEIGRVTAAGYGTADAPDALYVGAEDGSLYVRRPGAPVEDRAWLESPSLQSEGSGRVLQIIVDPRDWRHAIVLFENERLAETMDGGESWREATEAPFTSLTLVPGQDYDTLFLGLKEGRGLGAATTLGLDRSQGMISAMQARPYMWLKQNLPGAPIADLAYDAGLTEAGDEVLAIATLGRGAWKLDNPDDLFTFRGGAGDIIPLELNRLLPDSVHNLTSAVLESTGESLELFVNSAGTVSVRRVDAEAGVDETLVNLVPSRNAQRRSAPFVETGRYDAVPNLNNSLATDANADAPGFQGRIILTFTRDGDGLPVPVLLDITDGYSSNGLGSVTINDDPIHRLRAAQRLQYLGYDVNADDERTALENATDDDGSSPGSPWLPATAAALRLFQSVVNPRGELARRESEGGAESNAREAEVDFNTASWLNHASAPRWSSYSSLAPQTGLEDHAYASSWLIDVVDQVLADSSGDFESIRVTALSPLDGVVEPTDYPEGLGRRHQAGMEARFETPAGMTPATAARFVRSLEETGQRQSIVRSGSGGLALNQVFVGSNTLRDEIRAQSSLPAEQIQTHAGLAPNEIHVGFVAPVIDSAVAANEQQAMREIVERLRELGQGMQELGQKALPLVAGGPIPFVGDGVNEAIQLGETFVALADRLMATVELTSLASPTFPLPSPARLLFILEGREPFEVAAPAGIANRQQLLDLLNEQLDPAVMRASATTDGGIKFETQEEQGRANAVTLTTLRVESTTPGPEFGQAFDFDLVPAGTNVLDLPLRMTIRGIGEPTPYYPVQLHRRGIWDESTGQYVDGDRDNVQASDLAADLNAAFRRVFLDRDYQPVDESDDQATWTLGEFLQARVSGEGNDARLVLVSLRPEVASLELGGGGGSAWSTLDFAPARYDEPAPANALGFRGLRTEAETRFRTIPQLMAILATDFVKLSDAGLPAGFELDWRYDEATESLQFNVGIHRNVISEDLSFDFSEGIPLGPFGTLALTAETDAHLTGTVGLNLRLGISLADPPSRLTWNTPVDQLNNRRGLSPLVGVRADDAAPATGLIPTTTFHVSVGSRTGTESIPVTVTALAASDNLTAADLATDVNHALDQAGLGERLQAFIASGYFAILAIDPTISSLEIRGAERLGYDDARPDNLVDLFVTAGTPSAPGARYGIDLDGLTDLASLRARVVDATDGQFTVTISADERRLALTRASGPFFVTPGVLGDLTSSSAQILGWLGASTPADGGGHAIEGGSLVSPPAADRIFIVEPDVGEPNLFLSLRVQADEIDLRGGLGSVGLTVRNADRDGDSTPDPFVIDLGFGLNLSDPGTDADDGRITLAELLSASPERLFDLASARQGFRVNELAGRMELSADLGGLIGDAASGLVGARPLATLDLSLDQPNGRTASLDDVRFDVEAGGLEDLLGQLGNLSLEDVVAVVRDFVSQLADSNALPLFNQDLPLVNVSLRDMITSLDNIVERLEELVRPVAATELRAAAERVESAAIDLPLPLEEKQRLFRATLRLREALSSDEDLSFPRLISAVGELHKEVERLLEADGPSAFSSPGTDTSTHERELWDAISAVQNLVPTTNTIAERIRGALSSLIPGLETHFDIVDYRQAEPGMQTAVVIGLGYEIAETLAFPVTWPRTSLGPIQFELAGGDGVTGTVSGRIQLGLGVLATGDAPEFFVITETPSNTTADIIPTQVVLAAELSGMLGGRVRLGTLELVEAAVQAHLADAEEATVTLSSSSAFLPESWTEVRKSQLMVRDSRDALVSPDQYTIATNGGRFVLQSTSIDNGSTLKVQRLLTGSPASLSLTLPAAAGDNDLGALSLSDLWTAPALGVDVEGMLTGSASLTVLGRELTDALGVAVSLDHPAPEEWQITVDRAQLDPLLDNLEFDLTTIIAGLRAFLSLVEQGLDSQFSREIPLVGDQLAMGAKLAAKLREQVDRFAEELKDIGGTVEGVQTTVRTRLFEIFNGAGLLRRLDGADEPATPADVVVQLDRDRFEIRMRLGGVEEILEMNLESGVDFLPLKGQGGVTGKLEYEFDLGVGVDRLRGFYLLPNTFVGDPAQHLGDPARHFPADRKEVSIELELGLSVEQTPLGEPLPTSLSLSLFGIDFSATDMLEVVGGETKAGTRVGGAVWLDPTTSDPSGRLYFTEIVDEPFLEVFDPGLGVGAQVRLELGASIDEDLPSISADLTADWQLTVDRNGVQTSGRDLEFDNVTLYLGKFLSRQIGPSLQSLKSALAPLDPILKVLTAPIPVLSDAAGTPISLLTLVKQFAPGDYKAVATFVEVMGQVQPVIDQLGSLRDDVGINFGRLSLGTDVFEPEPGVPNQIDSSWYEQFQDPERLAERLDLENVVDQLRSVSGEARRALSALRGAPALEGDSGLGITLDFLEPRNIFKYLLGQTADVITWDIPKFSYAIDPSMQFPLIPVPPIFLETTLHVGMGADFSVGFDTRGIKTGNFLDGFYFGDRESISVGEDIDELYLDLRTTLGAALDLWGASIGVRGYLEGRADANWRDPDRNGKVYFDEMASIIAADGPLCLFEVTAELTAGAELTWEVLFASGAIPLTPEIQLFLIDNNDICPRFMLGHVSDGNETTIEQPHLSNIVPIPEQDDTLMLEGTLILHAGPLAGLRRAGNSRDVAEAFTLKELAPGVVEVRAMGLVQRFGGVQSVYFSGGKGADVLRLEGLNGAAFSLPVQAFGGDGDDLLYGGAAGDLLRGGLGNDTLVGNDGPDQLWGDGGDDVLYGDFDLDANPQAHDPDAEPYELVYAADTIEGGPGRDFIYAGPGDDVVYGGSGNDSILGQAGNDTLFGEAGNDWLDGGRDDDSGIFGGAGNDLLIGNFGVDQLFGGFGNDSIVAHRLDTPAATTMDYIEGGPNNDFICGSDGNNQLNDNGDGRIFGGTSDAGLARDPDLKTLADPVLRQSWTEPPLLSGGYRLTACFGGDVEEIPTPLGSIFGSVFVDLDPFGDAGFGAWNDAELSMADVEIQLLDQNGSLVAATTTGTFDVNGDGRIDPRTETGFYRFDGIDPGVYTVRQLVPSGHGQTTPLENGRPPIGVAPRIGLAHSVVVDANSTGPLLFGNQRLGAIEGRKWEDRDGDGVWDANERPLANVLIYLDPEIRSNYRPTDTRPLPLAVTDGNGEYRFTDLWPGTYEVREVVGEELQTVLADGQWSADILNPNLVPLEAQTFGLGLRQTFPGERLVYRNDFSGATIGAEWRGEPGTTLPRGATSSGEGGFLGLLSPRQGTVDGGITGRAISLEVPDLGRHEMVTVEFDLYLSGNWQGDRVDPTAAQACGREPDWWQVALRGGETLYGGSFSNTDAMQSYQRSDGSLVSVIPGFLADRVNELRINSAGGGTLAGPNSVYHFTIKFDHSLANLILDFASDGTCQGAWGLDNVSVTVGNDAHIVELGMSETVRDIDFGNQRSTRAEAVVVSQPTSTDSRGQILGPIHHLATVNEWDSYMVEVWLDAGWARRGIEHASVTLEYDSQLATLQTFLPAPGFELIQVVSDHGAGTVLVEVRPPTTNMGLGRNGPVLLGRMMFGQETGDQMFATEGTRPLRMEVSSGALSLAGLGEVEPQVGSRATTYMVANVFDIDENGVVGESDFAFFELAFGQTVSGDTSGYAYWADFDGSGVVDVGDFSLLAAAMGQSKSGGGGDVIGFGAPASPTSGDGGDDSSSGGFAPANSGGDGEASSSGGGSTSSVVLDSGIFVGGGNTTTATCVATQGPSIFWGHKYLDVDMDGRRDEAEPFTDVNGNGVWDLSEPFTDHDGDGRRDVDERGLPGVTIYLDYNEDGELNFSEPCTVTWDDDPSTLINEAGYYELNGIYLPGDYTVREMGAPGSLATSQRRLVALSGGNLFENPTNGALFDFNGDLVNERSTNQAGGNNIKTWIGMAMRPSDGAYFGATETALYRIDPLTGASTFLVALSKSIEEGDIAFDPRTETLYAISGGPQGLYGLYTIDVETGRVFDVGTIDVPDFFDPSAMAFDNQGVLHVLTFYPVKIWTIDLSSDLLPTIEPTLIADYTNLNLGALGDTTAGMVLGRETGRFEVSVGTSAGLDIPYRGGVYSMWAGSNQNAWELWVEHDEKTAGVAWVFSPEYTTRAYPEFGTRRDFGNFQPYVLPDGDDTIYGQDGNDRIYGDNLVSDPLAVSKGGSDTLYGNLGFDRLDGQEEDDVLWGADETLGRMPLFGKPIDRDTLIGGHGIDTVWVKVNDDITLTTTSLLGQGPDTLSGIEKAVLIGGAGDNTIDASGFVTGFGVVIQGLGGDDTIIGSPSDDELWGGDGSDDLRGGAGVDRYMLEPETSFEHDRFQEDSNEWGDVLDLTRLTSGVVVDLAARTSPTSPGNNRQLTFAGVGHVEVVLGGVGDDYFVGAPGVDNLLDGGSGNDTLYGVSGSNRLIGGAGDDTLRDGSDNDTFVFGLIDDKEWDKIVGDQGGEDAADFSALPADNRLDTNRFSGLAWQCVASPLDSGFCYLSPTYRAVTHGAVFIETWIGGAGDDVLFDNPNMSNVLIGGPGDDVYMFSNSTFDDYIREKADGGVDTLDFSRLTRGVDVNINGTFFYEEIADDSVRKLFSMGVELENVVGSPFDDRIIGNVRDNRLVGGGGSDTLEGRRGNDTYVFEAVATGAAFETDTVVEASGQGDRDVLDFSALPATVSVTAILSSSDPFAAHAGRSVEIQGPEHFEAVVGGQGPDYLEGNNRNNELHGQGGMDQLVGRGGSDLLVGGDGDDRYLFDDLLRDLQGIPIWEYDTVIESPRGGANDQLDFGRLTDVVVVDLSGAGVLASRQGGFGIVFAGTPETYDSIETVRGGQTYNVITGNRADNFLFGGNGGDVLIGLGGNDLLFGGGGTNTLIGSANDDTYVFVDNVASFNTLVEDLGSVQAGRLAPGGFDTLDFQPITQPIFFDPRNPRAQEVIPGVLTIELKDNQGPNAAYFELVLGGLPPRLPGMAPAASSGDDSGAARAGDSGSSEPPASFDDGGESSSDDGPFAPLTSHGSGSDWAPFGDVGYFEPDPMLHVEIVFVAAPSDEGLEEPPVSLTRVSQGGTFHAEIWLQGTELLTEGVSGGFVDLLFDPDATLVSEVNTSDFPLLTDGRVYDGLVDDLGGARFGAGHAASLTWTRLGYVTLTALGPEVTLSLAEGKFPFAQFGVGNIDWGQVTLGSATVIAAGCVVTHTGDAGPGSLREAIACANSALEGEDAVIKFSISQSDANYIDVDAHLPNGDAEPDVFVISPLSPLPALTRGGIRIDGHTQREVTGDTNPWGPEVALYGHLAGPSANGIEIRSAGNQVVGLNIQRFAGHGILIAGNSNQVAGNYVGTNATGTARRTTEVHSANGGSGILIDHGDANLIGGTLDADRNVISGNAQNGVFILGNSAPAIPPDYDGPPIFTDNPNDVGGRGNVVVNNYIGLGADGSSELGNQRLGIVIQESANNRIGLGDPPSGNVISANLQSGVFLSGTGSFGNRLQGNFIGTDARGESARGNRQNGVTLNLGARYNILGVDGDGDGDEFERNVISGHSRSSQGSGIWLGIGNHNIIAGNWLGLSEDGLKPLANVRGITVVGGIENRIGGLTEVERNVISGNIYGIHAAGRVQDLRIQGNFVGTDPTGQIAVRNLQGIELDGRGAFRMSGVLVGGPDDGAGNLISGNQNFGIVVRGEGASGVTIQGNRIGMDLDGVEPLPNGAGVRVDLANSVIVGGIIPGAGNDISGNRNSGVTIKGRDNRVLGNVIALNGGDGVGVSDPNSRGNTIRFNSIHSNRDLGIDLGENGVTPNDKGNSTANPVVPPDVDSGPNALQNYPDITSVRKTTTGANTGVFVNGVLQSTPEATFVIDLYRNPTSSRDGRTWLAAVEVTTNGIGTTSFAFRLPLDAAEVGNFLTTTATRILARVDGEILGNTSEFSTAKDVRRVGGRPLVAASSPSEASHATVMRATVTRAVAASVESSQLAPLVAAALERWQATGICVPEFPQLHVGVRDLPGNALGWTEGHEIWIDVNAAGWGWFIDATPGDDLEFTTPGDQGERDRMDLLSVVMHELGHVLGLEHDDEGLMQATLAAGVRRASVEEHHVHDVDRLFEQPLELLSAEWLGAIHTTEIRRDKARVSVSRVR